MTHIQAIKKAAEAATQGPRHVERDTEVKVDDDGITLALCDTNTAGIKEPGKDWYEEAKADAQLIAMLDPATVLELCRLAEIGEAVERGEYIHRDAVLEAEHEADEDAP